ncbi:MAG: helix-turn-helix domain-containing protein [Sphingomonadales bacterium]|nr:helix-turn-helix domain-containing protein [Sphingomonadales bacterium]MBU3993010.1 DUF2083 domain-containing protein [Alphaproteobacteria bacterium]
MSQNRPLYLGPRLRRLRRELGLTQQAMATDLAISPSYVALIERNQRPVTAELLLRLARSYKLDVAELAGEDSEDYARRIGEVLRDPLLADIDLPALEVADLATSFPGVTEAILRLHGAYVREQQALADQRLGPGPDETGAIGAASDPVTETRRFLAEQRNHFPALETRAEALAAQLAEAGGAQQWLRKHKNVRVRFLPPDVLVESVRRYDRHNEQLLLDDTLGASDRQFQLALHVAWTALREDIAAIVRPARFADKSTTALVRRALAGYAAAALVMPYEAFARAAEARAYDIPALGGLFGASFEQVAHRLTTLARAGHEGVPFFFLRVDEAGNVSKRLDGAAFPFAAHGGGCPLWSVHAAFRTPGQIVTQWLELPDGQRFFSLARTVQAGGSHRNAPTVLRSVALVCAAEHAPRLAWAKGIDPAAATPIGVACRLCQRADCTARAAPPIGRELLADDQRRSPAPYMFAEG